jgi:hypothetical protein
MNPACAAVNPFIVTSLVSKLQTRNKLKRWWALRYVGPATEVGIPLAQASAQLLCQDVSSTALQRVSSTFCTTRPSHWPVLLLLCQTVTAIFFILDLFSEHHYKVFNILSRSMSDYRRCLDWWLDLLTTFTLMTRDYILQITDT